MSGRLPRISLEPAPGYVPFVESHLATLRRDAQRLTGDGSIAEEVSSDVLTDVALRWYWFELLRALGRTDPAGSFLGVALNRRCARRQDEAETDADPRPVVLVQPVSPAPATSWPTSPAWGTEPVVVVATDPLPPPPVARAPIATSVAVRLALVAARPSPPTAALEAVIAWLHAYETYNRYRRIAAATVAVIFALVLAWLHRYVVPA